MRRNTLIKCLPEAKTLKNSLYESYDSTRFSSSLRAPQNRNGSMIQPVQSLHLIICPCPLTNHWLHCQVRFPFCAVCGEKKEKAPLSWRWRLDNVHKYGWTVRHQRNVHFVLGWIFPFMVEDENIVLDLDLTQTVWFICHGYMTFFSCSFGYNNYNNIIHMLQFAL